MSNNNIFTEGDRVEGWAQLGRPVFGTVKDAKTPYGMVVVSWDDDRVEDTHVREWDLTRTTAEEERATAIKHVQGILDGYGLNYAISTKDNEVLATNQ